MIPSTSSGSGSVEMSCQLGGLVVNLDIGGGTAKRTVISGGSVQDIAAINVGARLIVVDERNVVVRAEPAGLAVARRIGIDASPGQVLPADGRERLASVMADLLVEFLGLHPRSSLATSLLVTDAPAELTDEFWLVCSGGVSEYVYSVSEDDPFDLGPMLGKALRRRLDERVPHGLLLAPKEGIRATVIGACQFTLQVSGETVYASNNAVLPLTNVPVLHVPIDWLRLRSEDVASAIAGALASLDGDRPCALFLGSPQRFGYSKLTELARGIASAFGQSAWCEQTVLIFSQDIANTVGRSLRSFLPKIPYICIDEIEVANLDYVDIGTPPDGEPDLRHKTSPGSEA